MTASWDVRLRYWLSLGFTVCVIVLGFVLNPIVRLMRMPWHERDERRRRQCTCIVVGPDENGNYDLIEDDGCPRHGR